MAKYELADNSAEEERHIGGPYYHRITVGAARAYLRAHEKGATDVTIHDALEAHLLSSRDKSAERVIALTELSYGVPMDEALDIAESEAPGLWDSLMSQPDWPETMAMLEELVAEQVDLIRAQQTDRAA